MKPKNSAQLLYNFLVAASANNHAEWDSLSGFEQDRIVKMWTNVMGQEEIKTRRGRSGRRVNKAPETDRGIGFISQVTDPNAKKWSGDCGAASLYMQMQPFGFDKGWTVDSIQTAFGPCMGEAEHNLSGWDELVCVGQKMGARMSTDVGDWRHGDVILVDYSMISNRVDKGYGGWHWMCIVADWGDKVECNDPDSVGEGSRGIQYSKAEVEAAYVACGRRYVRCHNLDAGRMVVKSDSGILRLRDKPTLNGSTVVKEVPNETELDCSNLQGFFYEVKLDGKTLFAHAAYLFWAGSAGQAAVVATPVDADFVNMRVKPGTDGLNLRASPVSGSVITQLADGQEVATKPSITPGWLQVFLPDGTNGYCSADYLFSGDAPPKVDPAPAGPSLAAKFLPFRVGSHDIPDNSVWHNQENRGWLLLTALTSDDVPIARINEHKHNKGHLALRLQNDYGDTVPHDAANFPAFAQRCAEYVKRFEGQIDILQLFNEPDLEQKNVDPEHISMCHNLVAEAVLKAVPGLLISPAPISWYGYLAERGFSHPSQYATRLWRNIAPEFFTALCVHTYDHSHDGNQDQVFESMPDCGYNIGNIKRQIQALKEFGRYPMPILVSETNCVADTGAWPDHNTGWFKRTAKYLKAVDANVLGFCAFRWQGDVAYGRTWTWNRPGCVEDFRQADAENQ